MPPKRRTPRQNSRTPRRDLGRKGHGEEPKQGNTQDKPPKVNRPRIEQMVKDIFADNENKENREREKKVKRSGLSIAEQKYFDKKYAEKRNSERLKAQEDIRKQKREAHLAEIKANADNESILRKMCDNEGIGALVETKYHNMIDCILQILENEKEYGIRATFARQIDGLDHLGKKYKNVVNHYANLIKKLNPKVSGVETDGLSDKLIKDMQEDSEKIKKKRDELYNADDIDAKLQGVEKDITPAQIDEIKTLIDKKLQAAADKRLHILAKQKKKDRRALASANITPRTFDSDLST